MCPLGNVELWNKHFCDATRVSWHLKSPATQLFVHQYVQPNKTNKINALLFWPFVRWFHRWLVDSSHRVPVMQNCFHVMTSSSCVAMKLYNQVPQIKLTHPMNAISCQLVIGVQCVHVVDWMWPKVKLGCCGSLLLMAEMGVLNNFPVRPYSDGFQGCYSYKHW